MDKLPTDKLPMDKIAMNNEELQKIAIDGLWKNNPALVQMLGLCPLLAVSASVVNALALGLATAAVLTMSNTAVSLIRNYTTETVRLPTYILLIAAFTTCIEFVMHAYTYDLYLTLGIFIALIVTNCNVLGRADGFASKHPVLPAALDGLMTGLGFAAVLVVLGALREAIGQGTLFADMHLLFGESARNWTIHFNSNYPGFLFAIVPPGAFMFMGLLIALKNIVDRRMADRVKAQQLEAPVASRRVRTTGHIS